MRKSSACIRRVLTHAYACLHLKFELPKGHQGGIIKRAAGCRRVELIQHTGLFELLDWMKSPRRCRGRRCGQCPQGARRSEVSRGESGPAGRSGAGPARGLKSGSARRHPTVLGNHRRGPEVSLDGGGGAGLGRGAWRGTPGRRREIGRRRGTRVSASRRRRRRREGG